MCLLFQFFFTESDIGKNCAEVSCPRLAELNEYVRVEVLSGALTDEAISNFQVVVLTQSSLEEQRRIGDLCHSKDIKFIVASTRGLCGSVLGRRDRVGVVGVCHLGGLS